MEPRERRTLPTVGSAAMRNCKVRRRGRIGAARVRTPRRASAKPPGWLCCINTLVGNPATMSPERRLATRPERAGVDKERESAAKGVDKEREPAAKGAAIERFHAAPRRRHPEGLSVTVILYCQARQDPGKSSAPLVTSSRNEASNLLTRMSCQRRRSRTRRGAGAGSLGGWRQREEEKPKGGRQASGGENRDCISTPRQYCFKSEG